MAQYRIEGGKKLSGSVVVSSGKNSPVALLCASLMIQGTVVFKDISQVEDVERMIEILQSIGAKVSWQGDNILEIDASRPLTMDHIDRKACETTRASLLLFGALSSREKQFKLYKSGGCHLGERTIRPHVFALKKLGIHVESFPEYYEVTAETLRGTHIVMYESGDTATENVIMAAVCAQGSTTISFASANYMVQDLCHFLNAAGADITGIGTTTLIIQGGKTLHAVDEYYIMPDPVDAMAWISLGITTHSPITIENCPKDFLELELEKLSVMGQAFTIHNERRSKNGKNTIVDITIIPSVLRALPDKLYGRPYPGLNIDCVPLFMPILTQAKGQTLVHDWPYENRAIYALELQKLGANVILMDPHRVLIEGSMPLKGNELTCPPAIRPGMAILIAMIAAKGTSVLHNVYPLERAYDQLLERLIKLGVTIERIEE